ncbi:hypothetical protein GCM10010123_45380 [Pilimelia anulata]|uniref:DUF2218 domain-containing protein n=1 Tax=Pilimelia anulata TaxID=53371 RepID=A0A8J3BBU1_9ACTN|nr:DUF2218 domain-containing protein [Pilimelia anulata]GGK10317.1 hypothetical protein GCM10010123_45380 [Pilimelia anulata]
MTTHTSRAEVATDAPARYAKQLVAHLGRKLTFTTDGATSTTNLDDTTASITVGDNVLIMVAAGPSEEGVARAAHVLGSHLERFGQRNELAVTWTTTAE